MDDQTQNVTTVAMFLAMAARENIMLNGQVGDKVWEAFCSLMGWPQWVADKLKKEMTS
jgi:hypothetical protein